MEAGVCGAVELYYVVMLTGILNIFSNPLVSVSVCQTTETPLCNISTVHAKAPQTAFKVTCSAGL